MNSSKNKKTKTVEELTKDFDKIDQKDITKENFETNLKKVIKKGKKA